MTREELDTLWHKALIASVRDGEKYTRYHFAALVAAAERERTQKIVQGTKGELQTMVEKTYMEGAIAGAAAEREACVALHDHEDVLAPIGHSAWGEARQQGWTDGTAAYRIAIRARGKP